MGTSPHRHFNRFTRTIPQITPQHFPLKIMKKKLELIKAYVQPYHKKWVKKLVRSGAYISESDYIRTLIDNDIQANSK